MTQAVKRAYSSERRQQAAADTRRAIIDAAVELFPERGWSKTSVRDIARRAAVSVETVYASVGGKIDVLAAAIDVGVTGDLESVPLRERREYGALAEGDLEHRFAAMARLLASIYGRTAGINRALSEAALADERAAVLRTELQSRQRSDVSGALRLVLARTPTRTEAEGVWALMSFETYDNLVRGAGWSTTRYRRWLADALLRLLAEPRRS